MVDIPTKANLESYLVLAERVELLVSSATAGITANDKFLTMKEVEYDVVHPESRFNHGSLRSYGHAAPDIGIRFRLSVTHDVLVYLRTRGSRNSLGVIPTYKYAIKVTSNGGTSKTITVTGKLTEKKYVKNYGDQENPADAECLIRVLNEFEPVAT